MVRKILLFAVFVVCAVPVCAQGIPRSEVSLSYGVAPITDWIDTYTGLLGELHGAAKHSVTGWGAVTAGYHLRLVGGISIGAQIVYSSNKQSIRHTDARISTRYWSVMPGVKLNWLNLKVLTFYARAGVGASFSKAKSGRKEETATKFAFQLSPVGLEIGGRVAAYAEAGIGTAGCFVVGARYRF